MSDPLRPFEPSSRRPWDAAAAAHLLRRAGFEPSAGEVQAAVAAGLPATVARLVQAAEAESPGYAEVDALGPAIAVRDQIDALRGWWLLRMARSTRPLAARMAVAWHSHFATSNVKVRSAPLMLQQLRTLERGALGPFRALMVAVARDPAMIVWLDAGLNVKGRPNENFAREIFELFMLGVGNYSEQDIREAARALTGWRQRNGRFEFAVLDHDDGLKELFGRQGRLGGEDVIDAALAQPACARFLAGKLLREFVGPEPEPPAVAALAERLRATDYDVAATLATLLNSELFWDPARRRTRIKSPVEYLIGLVRSLELNVPAATLAEGVVQMGQALFEPPTVAGWDGHRTWLDSATMLVRLNAAERAVGEYLKPDELCRRYGAGDAATARELAIGLTLDDALPDAVRARLDTLDGPAGQVLREALRVLTACPEYQLA